MKKSLGIWLATITLVFAGVPVASADGYLAVNLAGGMVQDADFDLAGTTGALSYDAGLGGTVAVGMPITDGADLRGELEISYRSNDLDQIEVDSSGTAPATGRIESTAMLANLYLDLMPESPLTPFIGVGAGIASLDLEVVGLTRSDDTVFACQFAAGAALLATEKTYVELQYRYFTTQDPNLDGFKTEYAVQNLLVGLRFMF